MIKNLFVLLCAVLFFKILPAQSELVKIKGSQFYLDGHPFYYVGTNYWYGSVLALKKDKQKGIDRLRQELDFLKSHGVTNIRILGGAEGKGLINGVQRVGPPLQIKEGVFDPGYLKGMDVLLTELAKRKMTAVIYLSNNWNWSGGFLQYLKWNGLIPDSAFNKDIPWGELGNYTSKFYDCEKCKADYFKQVKYIVGHTNSITNKKYSEDPTIMAWEIANEPRPMRSSAINFYRKFISNTASLIKKIDSHHLVTTGTEGYMSTESIQLYKDVHNDKNIDYLTIHIWPKNWSWFKGKDIAGGMDSVISKTITYLNVHKKIAEELNEPLVIEEFGLPRDNHSYDIDSPTTYRDIYYTKILSEWLNSKRTSGPLAGVNFWAYGGIAKPIKGQIMWKEGDEYMGDPPMEEQGLNTVFNSDKSTWNVIDSFSKNTNKNLLTDDLPIDKRATQHVINLYHNLKRLQKKGIMFGHQDDLAYGVGWKYIPGKSDVKEVTGDYPAVHGFELGRIELGHPVNLDSMPFDKMRKYILQVYERGGVVTLSWHLNNPLTGKTAWNAAPGTVASILPGGERNELYKTWLDKVADFIVSLKTKNSVPVPVILRLFHELNGNWFWWGKDHCTPEEFKKLWQFTVSYLRDTKHIRQLLYAYNTDRFSSKEEYLLKYPGDEWTDVVGFDIYQRNGGADGNAAFIKDAGNMLTMLEEIASERNKIPALTEFGYAKVPDSSWWTQVFLKALDHHKICYALAWRNAGYMPSGEAEYYLPFKGQQSEEDFIKFYKTPGILFQKDITKEHLYK
ncbi:glycosyl hydrolase [Ginsengibacter hankyongi]|uniref:glycosyl hydrolase n=1 Tax=Ginsengibacter hankyongi TaxID=2607284 RepID=UPI0019264F6F|nr:glycosyl hydrolase [Ginsengibacter hankyongi]